ncbi:STAS domain-containing protein [Temperatibacter marinus]|uniref:STAS domain-containing protein n=1 Tax=Temperatibacter marinus TaxID=1456591 RepID=A0AA52H8G5_9PROT|nr:STAS domain-containing protein [Temperatibacter marinus]WND02106.1 STAS domain-containing protein [Temperatibacter marinus]
MEYSINDNGGNATVAIKGNITFSQNVRFRQMLKDISDASVKSCLLDISNVEMVDSAGLGMFLIAKEQSDTENWKLSVTGASGHVETMLKLTKLSDLLA